jgi:hypothetical protein
MGVDGARRVVRRRQQNLLNIRPPMPVIPQFLVIPSLEDWENVFASVLHSLFAFRAPSSRRSDFELAEQLADGPREGCLFKLFVGRKIQTETHYASDSIVATLAAWSRFV